MNKKLSNNMRLLHRQLGFFLAGIMAVYAISGIVLIFRDTDFLKKEQTLEKTLPTTASVEELGKAIKNKGLKIEREENGIKYFANGSFDTKTGIVQYQAKQLPFVLQKMTKLHKATTDDPLFYLNIFFGLALLFFVFSAFWMYIPSSKIFKKGMYFTLAGIVLTLLLLFI